MADAIRIDTPDALSGFLLVQKLEQLGAEVRSRDAERWEVRLPADRAAPRIDEVLGAVRRWLGEEQIASTVVHVEGRELVLTPLPRPRPA
jgi:hypothetical protein